MAWQDDPHPITKDIKEVISSIWKYHNRNIMLCPCVLQFLLLSYNINLWVPFYSLWSWNVYRNYQTFGHQAICEVPVRKKKEWKCVGKHKLGESLGVDYVPCRQLGTSLAAEACGKRLHLVHSVEAGHLPGPLWLPWELLLQHPSSSSLHL